MVYTTKNGASATSGGYRAVPMYEREEEPSTAYRVDETFASAYGSDHGNKDTSHDRRDRDERNEREEYGETRGEITACGRENRHDSGLLSGLFGSITDRLRSIGLEDLLLIGIALLLLLDGNGDNDILVLVVLVLLLTD